MSPVHLHLLLNHVPVIGTLVGLCLLAYAALRKDEGLARASLGMFALLALVAVATFPSATRRRPFWAEPELVERGDDDGDG